MNIIFDWSGVISDDFQICYEACMIVMDDKIGKTISIEEFKREFTLPYMNFWSKYVNDMDHKEENKRFAAALNKVDSQPHVFPIAKYVLHELKKQNHNMIVLSSQVNEQIYKEIDQYLLNGVFNEINGDVHDKSEAIHEIMRRNGFDPKETFYVGDMQHDMDAGKAAGVKRIAITTGYDTREKLIEAKPDYIINSLDELLKIVKKLPNIPPIVNKNIL